jgi:hypothetical protein
MEVIGYLADDVKKTELCRRNIQRLYFWGGSGRERRVLQLYKIIERIKGANT